MNRLAIFIPLGALALLLAARFFDAQTTPDHLATERSSQPHGSALVERREEASSPIAVSLAAAQTRAEETLPEEHDVLPKVAQGLAKRHVTQWAKTVAAARQGAQLRLPLRGGEVLEAVVTQFEAFEGGDFSSLLTLNNPAGQMMVTRIAGELSGRAFFDGKSAALTFTDDGAGGLLPEPTTVADQLCASPGAVHPITDERNFLIPPGPAQGQGIDRDFEVLEMDGMDDVMNLNSLPDADRVLYIDFDGEVVPPSWWSNSTITARAASYRDSDIQRIWRFVAEDFQPWRVNVTTNRAVFDAAAVSRRMMCIVTPTDTVAPGSGGVAFLNSFGSGQVCWAFSSTVTSVSTAISHEYGHTLGLRHDGDSRREYYRGHGFGVRGWGAIMGAAFTTTFQQWTKGEYAGASNREDDLAIISQDLPLKSSDHGRTPQTATQTSFDSSGIYEIEGLIETSNDRDLFRVDITTETGTLIINADGADPMAQNLDVAVVLLNSIGQEIQFSEPEDSLNVRATRALRAGTYYVAVEGDGWGAPLTAPASGWTRYGSVGKYKLRIQRLEGGVPPEDDASTPLTDEEALDLVRGAKIERDAGSEWLGQRRVTFDGFDSMSVGETPAGSTQTISMNLTGPGRVTFTWKLSSNNLNQLVCTLDGSFKRSLSGERDWTRTFVDVPAGNHTIAWEYRKRPTGSGGQDRAWLDQVVLEGFDLRDSFAKWIQSENPRRKGALDDSDEDGLENVLEYFYDSDPGEVSLDPVFTQETGEGDEKGVDVVFETRFDLSGLRYEVMAMNALGEMEVIANGEDNSPMGMQDGVRGNIAEDLIERDGRELRRISLREASEHANRIYQLRVQLLD